MRIEHGAQLFPSTALKTNGRAGVPAQTLPAGWKDLLRLRDEIQEVRRVCYMEWKTIHAEHQDNLPVQHGLLTALGTLGCM